MRSRSRSAWPLAGLTAVCAALIAGCSSGTPAAGPTVTVTATTGASSPSGSSATSPASGATTSASAGPGACQSSALKVTLGQGNAAAGTTFYEILFTNQSSASCTLYGFPGVSFTGESSSVQVGPAATRSPASHPALVTLAPGAEASAQISVVDAQNYSAGSCGLTTASGILVYPPNLTASVSLPFNGFTCVHKKDPVLTVDAVVAGPGSAS